MTTYVPHLLVLYTVLVPTFGVRFISEPDDLVAAHFQPVWWHCQAADDHHTVIYSWKSGGTDLPPDSSHTIYSNGTLLIAKVTNGDVGSYSCTATSGGESISSGEVTLKLAYINPDFTIQPEGQSVYLDDTVTLRCYIESLPEAEISWTLDGNTVTMATVTKETTGASTLTILPVMYDDAGEYKCTGRNPLVEVVRFSHTAELSVEGAPVFTDSLQHLVVPLAYTATFHCRFHGNPLPTVTWFVHSVNDDGNMTSTEIEPSNKYSVYENGTFVINNVTLDDNAYYTCRVENIFGEMSGSASLLATENATPPEFIDIPENITVTEGDNVTLTCKVTGFPTPKVWWEKDGTSLKHVYLADDGNLFITSIKREEGGYFTCVSKNDVGTISHTLYVDVQYLPVFTIRPRSSAVLQGTSVSLTCFATGNPEPKITWETPDSESFVSPSSSEDITVTGNGMLTINMVGLKHDGQFTCIATNAVGSSTERAYIHVEVPPKFMTLPLSHGVFINERVTFNCQASGSPTPIMSWAKDGEGEITSTPDRQVYLNNSLVIHSARLEHSGVYRCYAENNRGMIESIAALTVLVPPQFTTRPRNQTVRVGSTVSVDCVADGDPVPSQKWLKDGRMFHLDRNMVILPNFTLTISDIRDSQFGLYECVATSQAGTISTSALVEREDFPVMTTHPQNSTVNVTATVTLYCEGVAKETPSVAWYRIVSGEATPITETMDRVTVTDGRLEIQEVSKTDEGWYLCVIQNTVGELSANAFVRVQVPPIIMLTNSPQSTTNHSSAALSCQSSGDPAPTLDWINPHGHVIGSSSAYIVAGYTLQIVSANESTDGGKWTCRACNILGCDEALIQLNIEGVPVIFSFHGNPTGTTVTLTCIAAGYPTPTLTFTSQGQIVTSKLEGHSVEGNSIIVENGSKRRDYTCKVRNKYGMAQHTMNVPGKVLSLTIISIKSREATLSWTTPEELGALPLIGYKAGFPSAGVSPWQQNGKLFTENRGIVEGLVPYTDYRFRVAAINILGAGEFSDLSATRKTLADAPSPPTHFIVRKTGNDGIVLTWQQPEFINGEAADIEYRYQLQSVNTFDINDHVQSPVSGTVNLTSGTARYNDTTEVVIGGLTEPLVYRVTVWAVNRKLNKSSEPVQSTADFTVGAPHVTNYKPDRLIPIVFGILGGVIAILVVVFVVSHVRHNRRKQSLSLIKARPSLDQFYMENPKNLYDKKTKQAMKRLSGQNFYKFENDDSFHSNSFLDEDNGQSPHGKKCDPDVLLMAKNPLFEGEAKHRSSSPASSVNSPFRTADEDWRQSCELSELEIPDSSVLQGSHKQKMLPNTATGSDVIGRRHDGKTGHVTQSSAGQPLRDNLDSYSSSSDNSSGNRQADDTSIKRETKGQTHSPLISKPVSNGHSPEMQPCRVVSGNKGGKSPKNISTNHEHTALLSITPKEPFKKVKSLPTESHKEQEKVVTFSDSCVNGHEPEYSKHKRQTNNNREGHLINYVKIPTGNRKQEYSGQSSNKPNCNENSNGHLIKSVETPKASLNGDRRTHGSTNGVNGICDTETRNSMEIDQDWVTVPEMDLKTQSYGGNVDKVKAVDIKVVDDSVDNNSTEETRSAQLY